MKRLTFKERIDALTNWYAKKNRVRGYKSFEKHCGLSNAYCRNLMKRDDRVNEAAIEKIADAIPEVNRDWLAYGEGPMLKADIPLLDINGDTTGSPYFNVDFLGGFDSVVNDQTRTPDGFINMPPYNGDDYLWCNITGDSMSPLIKSGSKICLRKLSGVDSIVYGAVYALVIGTDDMMRTVKWVTRSDNEEMIRLVPENKDWKYGRYQDVRKSDVLHVFKVVFSGSEL